MKKILLASAVSAILSMIAGCGGGGGGDSSAPPALTPILTTSNYSTVSSGVAYDLKTGYNEGLSAYHYLPSGSNTYVNSMMRYVLYKAGLISLTGTTRNSEGYTHANTISAYLSTLYLRNPISSSTNGNTTTNTYSCGSGTITEVVNDVSGNGSVPIGAGDNSTITFNSCANGSISATGSITLTAISVTGTPEVTNAAAILDGRVDFNNLTGNIGSDTYRISGSGNLKIDTLNYTFSDASSSSNISIYEVVGGKITSETNTGSYSFLASGNSYTHTRNISATGSTGGTNFQASINYSPALQGSILLPSNAPGTINAPSQGVIEYIINNQKMLLSANGNGFFVSVDLDNNGTTDASTTIGW